MIVATVPASLIERTRRLNCEVYFGRRAEARVANAHAAIRRAHKQLTVWRPL